VQENNDNLQTVLGLVSSQDQVEESQNNDQLAGQEYNDDTAVALSGQQYDYLNDEASDATSVNLTALQDQTSLDSQAQQDQYNLSQTTLNAVANAGLDHPINEVTQLGSIAEAALGAYGPSEASAAEGSVQSEASAAESASLAKTITGGVTSTLAGLFA
jgi:hypothetical protein